MAFYIQIPPWSLFFFLRRLHVTSAIVRIIHWRLFPALLLIQLTSTFSLPSVQLVFGTGVQVKQSLSFLPVSHYLSKLRNKKKKNSIFYEDGLTLFASE